MIIGGEHYFTPSSLFRKSKGYFDNLVADFKNEYFVNFTFGGYYSLLAILDNIKPILNDESVILLPSYLCTTILKPFKLRGVSYKFYRIDCDLFIDTDHLISMIDEKVKAILFIDYFGASQLYRIKPIIKILREKNIRIIQDVVQCLEINQSTLFGDYIFNSFRKFFPFEGSIILSKLEMKINFSKYPNKYIKYKRMGQLLRYLHIELHLFSSKLFLKFLKMAEDNYYSENILPLEKFNMNQLNKFDLSEIIERQKKYYTKLLNLFENHIPELLKKNDFVPFGFVIKINERDTIRRKMFKQNIFPPIHWILSEEIEKKQFENSILLASEILTIPLLYFSDKKYEYLFDNLNRIIGNESISKSIRN